MPNGQLCTQSHHNPEWLIVSTRHDAYPYSPPFISNTQDSKELNTEGLISLR